MTRTVHLHALVAVVFSAVVPAMSLGTPPGSGYSFHVPMPDQELFVECRIGSGDEVRSAETILKLRSTMSATDLDEQVALPAPFKPVRIRKYLAKAVREQQIEATDKGLNAILLTIEGKKQSFERWLIAGDIERGRLTSMVGTWRYNAVASKAERDELYRQFKRERDRPATLFVTRDGSDEMGEMPAKPGTVKAFQAIDCKIKVVEFFPHFGFDEKTKKPVNQSELRENPAALVEIEHAGSTEERWVFAKFPDYNAKRGSAAAIGVRLDCPVETKDPAPDFVLVTVENTKHEAWTRHNGTITAKPIDVGSSVPIPESNYVFAIGRFVPSGHLTEVYRTTDQKRGAVTAVRVDVNTADDTYTPIWIELGKARVVTTKAGPVTIMFGSRPLGTKGGN